MLGDVWVPEVGGTLAGQKKECEAFSLNPLFQGLLLGDLHMKWYLIHWHFVGSRKSAMARELVKGGLSQKAFNWSTIRLQPCRTSDPLREKTDDSQRFLQEKAVLLQRIMSRNMMNRWFCWWVKKKNGMGKTGVKFWHGAQIKSYWQGNSSSQH